MPTACSLHSSLSLDLSQNLQNFVANTQPRLLLISYDTARLNSDMLRGHPLGLMVCDEAHKLKNTKTALFSSLFDFKTTMRIMVTGTPIQNGLEEFYALLHFCIPNALGTEKEFSHKYGKAIEKARDADATDHEISKGLKASTAFVGIVKQLMLRRNNEVRALDVACPQPAARQAAAPPLILVPTPYPLSGDTRVSSCQDRCARLLLHDGGAAAGIRPRGRRGAHRAAAGRAPGRRGRTCQALLRS